MAVPVVTARSGVLIEGGKRLICSTLGTLHARLNPNSRLLGLDVTRTHVAISISDADRQQASPFGVIRRSSSSPLRDAAILRSAFASEDEELSALFGSIHGAVIGANRVTLDASAAYVGALFSDMQLLPNLHSFLYYSEAACVVRATNSARDVYEATRVLTDVKEKRKVLSKFDAAMYAAMDDGISEMDRSQRARISSSEILQAALDDLARLEIQENEERALQT